MKAYTVCLLALATLFSAQPKPSGGGGKYGGGGATGSPETTPFPRLNSAIGRYGGTGTGTGRYRPPASTSSAVRTTLHQDISRGSEDSKESSDETDLGNSGSQSLRSGPSGVAGSRPVSTAPISTSNTTSGRTKSSGKITLPAGCESVNDIGFGWLPDCNGASCKLTKTQWDTRTLALLGTIGRQVYQDGIIELKSRRASPMRSQAVSRIQFSLPPSCYRGLP